MNRRTFLALTAMFGLAPPALLGCAAEPQRRYWDFEVNFSGRVLIVGAGAAGLAAAYLLERYGIEFEIVEASAVYGGRVKRSSDFADFPIDLGAEWIHEEPTVLTELIDDPDVDASVELVPFTPDSIATYHGGKLRRLNLGTAFYGEYKFESTTWFGFLAEHFAARVEDRISYGSPVTAIDSSGERVRVVLADGSEREADKVLVTAPITVLQRGDIEFTPAWPQAKADALASYEMPDGIKVFLEFDEHFYPEITLVGGGIASSLAYERIYYDAAFRKDSERNILGLFCVGSQATMYTSAASEDALVDMMLAELDEMFDGRATPSYAGRHVVQNWTAEPFVGGSYAAVVDGDEDARREAMLEPLDGKVYFAGEAFDIIASSTVPGAMRSGYVAVERMLREG